MSLKMGHLKVPNQKNKKGKKNEKQWRKLKGIIRHHQENLYMHYECPRRKEKEKWQDTYLKQQ